MYLDMFGRDLFNDEDFNDEDSELIEIIKSLLEISFSIDRMLRGIDESFLRINEHRINIDKIKEELGVDKTIYGLNYVEPKIKYNQ